MGMPSANEKILHACEFDRISLTALLKSLLMIISINFSVRASDHTITSASSEILQRVIEGSRTGEERPSFAMTAVQTGTQSGFTSIGGMKKTGSTLGAKKAESKACASGCGFQVTWLGNYCCYRCSQDPMSHGPKCEKI